MYTIYLHCEDNNKDTFELSVSAEFDPSNQYFKWMLIPTKKDWKVKVLKILNVESDKWNP